MRVLEKSVHNNQLQIPNIGQLGKKGEQIQGTILGFQDQSAIVKINNNVFAFNSGSLANKKTGEKVSFEIIGMTNNKIELKYIADNALDNEVKLNKCTQSKAIVNLFDMISSLEDNKEETNEEDIKNGIELFMSRVTEKDIDRMIKEGYNPEKIPLGDLNKILNRIKETKVESNAEGLEKLVDQYSEITNNTEQLKSIISKLQKNNLPVNAYTIAKILKAVNQHESFVNLNHDSIVYLLKNDLEINLDNLYKATYSAGKTQTKEIDFQSLEGQIEKIFEESHIEHSKENMATAKMLIENDVHITIKNFDKIREIKLIKEMNQDEIVDLIANNIRQGKSNITTFIDSTNRNENIVGYYEEIQTKLINIKDQKIKYAIKENLEVNINKISEVNISNEEITLDKQSELKFISAKRELEEIRLKLTYDSARKLINKGILIETEKLDKIVESLREIEKEHYHQLLEENNVEKTQENYDILKETDYKVQEIKNMPMTLMGKLYNENTSETIDEIHILGLEEKANVEKAHNSYESLMTQPRKDLGDSIVKTYNQIHPILEDLGLEITQQNERAVKALAYHQMPINEDNIMVVKNLDIKINHLLKAMHPSIIVQFIKEGKNPLHMPMDDLLIEITDIKEKMGFLNEEKYSEYIWQLDKDKEINENERNALIGIYRLLSSIEKSEGKVVGFLINQNQEINLKNLLTATRLMTKRALDITIDEDFGLLEELKLDSKNIEHQIDNGILKNSQTSNNSKIDYYSNLLKEFEDTATLEKLQFLNEDINILDLSMEKLVDRLSNLDMPMRETQIEEKTNTPLQDKIQMLSGVSVEAIAFMNQFEMPYTIENIVNVQTMLQNNFDFKDVLKTIMDSVNKESKDSIVESLENLLGLVDENRIEEQLDHIKSLLTQVKKESYVGNMTTNLQKAFEDSEKLFQIQNYLSKKEYFQLPIIVDGQITQFNVQFIHKNEGANKEILCSLPTKTFGNVKSKLSINNNEVFISVELENENYRSKFERSKDKIINGVQALGYEVKHIDIRNKSTEKGVLMNNRTKLIKEGKYDIFI
ncbi:hypothetical protein EDC18_1185 [Natranaerovirga pectinivora]|uniref:Flagellar hook-length control protein FliK n=1 Tax=Natranaerovirga pectinivora TaxID=682400 RepID=A0A4R3MDU5_9FIRM|nr:DUF6240 domain-containing protein [Natranaerovirga pectinivora]TCT11626.1 hypothetical protein EDC18_1185 [Natranaerovirga pectinivora]